MVAAFEQVTRVGNGRDRRSIIVTAIIRRGNFSLYRRAGGHTAGSSFSSSSDRIVAAIILLRVSSQSQQHPQDRRFLGAGAGAAACSSPSDRSPRRDRGNATAGHSNQYRCVRVALPLLPPPQSCWMRRPPPSLPSPSLESQSLVCCLLLLVGLCCFSLALLCYSLQSECILTPRSISSSFLCLAHTVVHGSDLPFVAVGPLIGFGGVREFMRSRKPHVLSARSGGTPAKQRKSHTLNDSRKGWKDGL